MSGATGASKLEELDGKGKLASHLLVGDWFKSDNTKNGAEPPSSEMASTTTTAIMTHADDITAGEGTTIGYKTEGGGFGKDEEEEAAVVVDSSPPQGKQSLLYTPTMSLIKIKNEQDEESDDDENDPFALDSKVSFQIRCKIYLLIALINILMVGVVAFSWWFSYDILEPWLWENEILTNKPTPAPTPALG